MCEPSDRRAGPDGPETLACFLMSWLDPAKPDECHVVVDLMKKMIGPFAESYAARQHDDE